MTAKELREKLGLKQHEMAAKLGCSATHVCHIENGLRIPSLRIAQEYGSLSKGKVTLASFKIH